MNAFLLSIPIKIVALVFFIISSQIQAQPIPKGQYLPIGTRLAMGYYYPSLSIVSNPTDIEISLNYWIQELTSSVGMNNAYSILYHNIVEMNRDFEAGKLDMIIAPPLLIATVFNKDLLADGFVGVDSSDQINYLTIIARKEIGKEFNGYRRKRLLLPKNDLLAKIFLEKEVLKQYQQSLTQVFSDIKTSNKNQRMVLDLFFNKADIAIVYENSLKVIFELNPQLEQKIQRLDKLPLLSRNFGYFHTSFPFQQKLRNGMQKFNQKARGRQILQVFHTTDIKTCKVSYLDEFNTLYDEYLGLKKKHTHK